MNPDNVIEVNSVYKSYKMYTDRGRTLKERVLNRKRREYHSREVLKGISFDIKKGEAVGLIGANGCGKSTTLKLLTRILRPDSGTININGKVYSMIELGAGFHPDMSGRENIYINASIFGIGAKEVDRRLDRIIEFSGLEKYIDNPVRTYSSGMYMRLAFSIAINVDADILLIDEILAVGDAAFQAKCIKMLREIKKRGTTIVLVSHSVGQVEQLCDRCIWICDGVVKKDGNPYEVTPVYLDYVNALQTAEDSSGQEKNSRDDNSQKNRHGNMKATITSIEMLDGQGISKRVFDSDESCTLRVEYKANEVIDAPNFGIHFFRNDGIACYGTTTVIDRVGDVSVKGDGAFEFVMPRLSLVSGEYWIDVAIVEESGLPVDYWREAIQFMVTSNIADIDCVRIQHTWRLES